jgi:hypothetical protein
MSDRVVSSLLICFMAGAMVFQHEVLAVLLLLAAVGIVA